MARQTDQKRKAAAIADLLNGDQPAVVAARYKLNATTVRSWKARLDLPTATGVATGVAVVQPQIEAQQLALGDLVMENLRAKLLATQKIAEHATTTTWLEKQGAAELAELFEVLDRSAVGILDRLARGSRADDPEQRDA